MTSKTTRHITLTFKTETLNGTDVEITNCYIVSEKTLHSALAWLAHQKHQTANALDSWLRKHDAKLDRRDGPAMVERYTSGNGRELYYRNGKIHRGNGPAVITRAHCMRNEEYYREGKYHRDDGPAVVTRLQDGSIRESYYNRGRRHREDGPAFIIRKSDGSVREQSFYVDGKRVDRPPLLQHVIRPGITIIKPLPSRHEP